MAVTVSGPLGAILLVAAFAAATLLVAPAALRRALGPWHPAAATLALHAVFFGLGAATLAVGEERTGPALYLAGAVVAFGLGVAASDRLAARRAAGGTTGSPPLPGADTAPLRPWAVAAAVGLALLAIAPTLLRVGIPFLADDVTGARVQLTGLPVQLGRVALPGLAVGALIVALRRPTPRLRAAALAAIGAILLFDLALASRYLAAELAAGLVVAWALAGRPTPLRALLALAVAAGIVFGGVQVLRVYDQATGRELAFAIERTVNRVVLVQPRTLDALQEAIPAEHPYFGGLTWVDRVAALATGEEIPDLGYWIFPRLFPGQEPPGYLAPGVIGEAWANLGPAGLALFLGFGIVAERLGALVARRRHGTADLVVGAMVVVFTARTHALGVNGLVLLLLLVLAWRVVAGREGGLAGELRATLAWRT